MTSVMVAFGLAVAGVEGVQFQIDSGQSSARLEACVMGTCDDDVSAIQGTIAASFDCPNVPREMSLEDFDISLTDTIDLHLDYGIFGDLFATGTGLGVAHIPPPESFVLVTNGAFTVSATDFVMRGAIAYDASGFVCTYMQNSGYSCSDTIVLDGLTGQGEMTGNIQVSNGTMHLTSSLDITQPLDPNNPDLGTIHLTATIRASAPLPDVNVVKKVKAGCRGGKLKAIAVMRDESLSGQDARFSINDVDYTTTINGSKAKLILPNQTGAQVVRLLDPPNCEGKKTADCG